MNEENKRTIQLVIHTLNNITVKGEDNMDQLLGSIHTLRYLLENDVGKAEVVEDG